MGEGILELLYNIEKCDGRTDRVITIGCATFCGGALNMILTFNSRYSDYP